MFSLRTQTYLGLSRFSPPEFSRPPPNTSTFAGYQVCRLRTISNWVRRLCFVSRLTQLIYLIEISSEGDFELGRSYLGCIASKGRAIGCVAFALPCLILAEHRRSLYFTPDFSIVQRLLTEPEIIDCTQLVNVDCCELFTMGWVRLVLHRKCGFKLSTALP